MSTPVPTTWYGLYFPKSCVVGGGGEERSETGRVEGYVSGSRIGGSQPKGHFVGSVEFYVPVVVSYSG